jgi:ABC-type sugar transport system ATPase subunit
MTSPAGAALSEAGGTTREGGADGAVLLEMTAITKRFPGVTALADVDFEVRRGEVHVLLGENGAGKSTLIKIIAGVETADAGTFAFDGRPLAATNPAAMRESGISVIYQELSLVEKLDVTTNLFLGRDRLGRGALARAFGVRDRAAMRDACAQAFERLGIRIDPGAVVAGLSISERQLLEITKAVAFDAKLILMDEPTSSLGPDEKTELFRVVNALRPEGIGIVFVSHILEDCLEIGDRVTVLRDGRRVMSAPISEIGIDRLITAMTGRPLRERYPKIRSFAGVPILEVRGLSRERVLRGISLTLRRGEILGLAGLVGARRTDLVRCLFGLDPADAGEIRIDGAPVSIGSPREAIAHGIFLLTEDRKSQGVFGLMSTLENIAITALNFDDAQHSSRLAPFGVISRANTAAFTKAQADRLRVKAASLRDPISQLSGGNQQKALLARALAMGSAVVILDEPTKGIDAGAKVEIYGILEEMAGSGIAILIVSSEFPEVTAICHRFYVMSKGQITGEFHRNEFSMEQVMRCATA